MLYGLTASAAALPLAQATPATASAAASETAVEVAFQQPIAGLAAAKLDTFLTGNHIFQVDWNVAAIAPQPFDGLGPLFSRSSCAACHPRNGRGRPPALTESLLSLVVRLEKVEAPAHETYGAQLDVQAISGCEPEGRPSVRYTAVRRRFADGTAYELQRPVYAFADLRFGAFGHDVLVSPRMPPGVYGLGLLEAVEAEEVLALADPEDRNRDGISGRPAWISGGSAAKDALGRFGWKAESPSLRLQVAGALSRDMGITSTLFPAPTCSAAELDCRQARSGGDPEISDDLLNALVTYMQLLAPPAPRQQNDPAVRRGRHVFYRAGCHLCHRPVLRTGPNPEHPEISRQTLHPFTDLLLHDMGPDLADGLPGHVRSQEWRTPPLWGIGLSEQVNENAFFLHDGRARNVLEAILWHGGEAERSRRIVEGLPKADRDDLAAFVNAL